MPRILITTQRDDQPPLDPSQAEILLDEHVHSVHLSTAHAAEALVERLAWAIHDAERRERSAVSGRAMAPLSTAA